MDMGILNITLHILTCCSVFVFFVAAPLKSRFRYSILKTGLYMAVIVFYTQLVMVFVLRENSYLFKYSEWGSVIWLIPSVFVFHRAIKGGFLESLFILLVALNLYSNIMAIVKLVAGRNNIAFPEDIRYALISIAIMISYLPLLYSLFIKQYRQVVELNVSASFWKLIWLLPVLTYIIFYMKIVEDYWKRTGVEGAGDILFVVLWSFVTYALYWITLQTVMQAYKVASAVEQMHLMEERLSMQEEQCRGLMGHFRDMDRLRHDWRHHLVSLNGFVKNGDLGSAQTYLQELLPKYVADCEQKVCQNRVLDVVFRHYRTIAREREIAIDIQVEIPELPGVSDLDLCILFGNLLENAADACISQRKDKGSIWIKARKEGRQLIVLIRNTFEGQVLSLKDVYLSTKHVGFGVGLTSVCRIVEKYDGVLKIEDENGVFCVSLMINTKGPRGANAIKM